MNEKMNTLPGRRVKDALKAAGITQRDLAEKLNYTENYISQIVRGKRNLPDELARRIAELTGVRLEYLICSDDYMTIDDQIEGFLDYHDSLTKGYRSFLSMLARRSGAVLRVEKSGQKIQCECGEIDLHTYLVTTDSGSSEIPESEMGEMTDEILEFAEFKFQRLVKRHLKTDDHDAVNTFTGPAK